MSEPDPLPFDFLPNDPIRRRICNHGVRQFRCTQWICRKEIFNLRYNKDTAQPQAAHAQLQASQPPVAPPSPPGPQPTNPAAPTTPLTPAPPHGLHLPPSHSHNQLYNTHNMILSTNLVNLNSYLISNGASTSLLNGSFVYLDTWEGYKYWNDITFNVTVESPYRTLFRAAHYFNLANNRNSIFPHSWCVNIQASQIYKIPGHHPPAVSPYP